MFPRRIVVVGGGTAGWLAACGLSLWAAGRDVQITVLHDGSVSPLSVGEGATLALRPFLEALGIDEPTFFRKTNGTFKLGIRYTNWLGNGETWLHPFDNLTVARMHSSLGHELEAVRMASTRLGRDFNVQSHLIRAKRAPLIELPGAPVRSLESLPQWDGSAPGSSGFGYSYHFDARGLQALLQVQAVARGVKQLVGRVTAVKRDPTGWVRAVETSGRTVEADLWVDATGFHRVLADPQSEWVSYRDSLLADTAIPAWISNEGELPTSTLAEALPAGWLWGIPLQHRLGFGYVFSSDHEPEGLARRRLRERLGPDAEIGDPIRFSSGRLEQHLRANVVSVGLSSNFAEPLEATSIHATLFQLHRLTAELSLGLWPLPASSARAFNRDVNTLLDESRDFLAAHYLTPRTEPFWRDARAAAHSDRLAGLLERFANKFPSDTDFDSVGRFPVFAATPYAYVLAGLQFFDPSRVQEELVASDLAQASGARYQQIKGLAALISRHALPHRQALARMQQEVDDAH